MDNSLTTPLHCDICMWIYVSEIGFLLTQGVLDEIDLPLFPYVLGLLAVRPPVLQLLLLRPAGRWVLWELLMLAFSLPAPPPPQHLAQPHPVTCTCRSSSGSTIGSAPCHRQ